MTNIEKIKEIMCDAIRNMSDEELFDLIAEEEEFLDNKGESLHFPKEALFTCVDCRNMYGDCERQSEDEGIGPCLERFVKYGHMEAK